MSGAESEQLKLMQRRGQGDAYEEEMCDRTGEILNGDLTKAVQEYKMYNVYELICTEITEERAQA